MILKIVFGKFTYILDKEFVKELGNDFINLLSPNNLFPFEEIIWVEKMMNNSIKNVVIYTKSPVIVSAFINEWEPGPDQRDCLEDIYIKTIKTSRLIKLTDIKDPSWLYNFNVGELFAVGYFDNILKEEG